MVPCKTLNCCLIKIWVRDTPVEEILFSRTGFDFSGGTNISLSKKFTYICSGQPISLLFIGSLVGTSLNQLGDKWITNLFTMTCLVWRLERPLETRKTSPNNNRNGKTVWRLVSTDTIDIDAYFVYQYLYFFLTIGIWDLSNKNAFVIIQQLSNKNEKNIFVIHYVRLNSIWTDWWNSNHISEGFTGTINTYAEHKLHPILKKYSCFQTQYTLPSFAFSWHNMIWNWMNCWW
jgi:hypothetical protein